MSVDSPSPRLGLSDFGLDADIAASAGRTKGSNMIRFYISFPRSASFGQLVGFLARGFHVLTVKCQVLIDVNVKNSFRVVYSPIAFIALHLGTRPNQSRHRPQQWRNRNFRIYSKLQVNFSNFGDSLWLNAATYWNRVFFFTFILLPTIKYEKNWHETSALL